jgi:hypothetical protein
MIGGTVDRSLSRADFVHAFILRRRTEKSPTRGTPGLDPIKYGLGGNGLRRIGHVLLVAGNHLFAEPAFNRSVTLK